MVVKKIFKDSVGFMKVGILSGVGAGILGSVGDKNAGAGLAGLTSQMGNIGKIKGAGYVMGSLKKLGKK